MPPAWSYAYLGDRLLARFDNAGNIEHVVTDHIGYPTATISYTGTVRWQPDPEPFGDVYAEQSVGSGHDPLIRYPGQWRVDPVLATTEPAFTTLYYNTHRWYNPSWGRYTQADPIGMRGGGHLYRYAYGNPLRLIDPLGLKVYLCCAPAQILLGLVDHCWIKTDTLEAGLSNLDEGQPPRAPGGQCDSPWIAQMQVVTHVGESETRPGTSCTEIPDVDEQCVNDYLWTDSRGYGATAGAITPTNNCQSWAIDVLDGCKPKCDPEPAFNIGPWPPGVLP